MALKVYREYRGTFELVGEFERADPVNETFAYDEGYLERDDAAALSASLPLRHEPYADAFSNPPVRLFIDARALGR